MEKNVLIRLNYIMMREILAFVSFLVGLTFISCTSKIEGKDCGVYKVSSEMVYYYCIHANAGVLWTDVRG